MTVEEIQQLKDLFQDIVCAKVSALEKLTTQRFEAMDEALKLQAEKYEQRLSALNGEADRLNKMQTTYLPREVFDKINEAHCRDLDELKSYRDKQIGRNLAISAGTSGGIAAAITVGIKLLGG